MYIFHKLAQKLISRILFSWISKYNIHMSKKGQCYTLHVHVHCNHTLDSCSITLLLLFCMTITCTIVHVHVHCTNSVITWSSFKSYTRNECVTFQLSLPDGNCSWCFRSPKRNVAHLRGSSETKHNYKLEIQQIDTWISSCIDPSPWVLQVW